VRMALYHLEDCAQCEMARLALAVERIGYESLLIDPADRSEVQRISGQRRVPVLVDTDGSVFVEAPRILRHLAAGQGARLLPGGRRDQTLTWVLVERADERLAPLCHSLGRRIDAAGTPLGEDELRAVRRRLGDELAVIEGVLERGPFLFGDHPTVADVAVHAMLNRLSEDEVQRILTDHAWLARWYGLVLQAAGRGA